MLNKIVHLTAATAVVLMSATASFAASKAHSTNRAYDVYDSRGWYVGSDPDPTVRAMLQRDRGE